MTPQKRSTARSDGKGEGKETGSGGGGRIFTSSNAFNEWLSKQPDNTPSTAYTVRLSVDYLDIYLYGTKYIILDLVGSTITSFGWAQFSGWTNLVGIIITASVTTIQDEAFNYCFGLTSIIIPASVTSIGRSAFEHCTSLTSVTFQGIFQQYLSMGAFDGDLARKYSFENGEGGVGTYTRPSGSNTWTKQ